MYFKLSRKFAAVERNENHAMHPFSFWCNRNGIFIIWTNTTQFTSYRKHTLHMRSWRYPDRSWLLWRMNKHQRKCIWWNEDDGNLMNFVCVCSMNIETVSNVLFPVTLFGPVSFLTLSLSLSLSVSMFYIGLDTTWFYLRLWNDFTNKIYAMIYIDSSECDKCELSERYLHPPHICVFNFMGANTQIIGRIQFWSVVSGDEYCLRENGFWLVK